MFRNLVLFAGLSFAGQAMATVTFQSLSWQNNDRFELTLGQDSGMPLIFKGDMRRDEKAHVELSKLKVDLKSYYKNGPFVTVIITAESQDLGVLYVLTEQESGYAALNERPIVDRRALIITSLDGIIERLSQPSKDENRPAWTLANIFAKLNEYFAANPRKQLTDFYDEVELNKFSELPKPQPRDNEANRRGGANPPRETQYQPPQYYQNGPPPYQRPPSNWWFN